MNKCKIQNCQSKIQNFQAKTPKTTHNKAHLEDSVASTQSQQAFKLHHKASKSCNWAYNHNMAGKARRNKQTQGQCTPIQVSTAFQAIQHRRPPVWTPSMTPPNMCPRTKLVPGLDTADTFQIFMTPTLPPMKLAGSPHTIRPQNTYIHHIQQIPLSMRYRPAHAQLATEP
jgi:hypothetical protein